MIDPPSLRADARRNREKLLVTARAAFAEHGIQASLDEIARNAGVGCGTLYRHFPTREALVRAVFLERITENLALLEAAGQCDDPWAGLAGWLRETSRTLATDRGYADVVADAELSKDLGVLRRRTYEAMSTVVERAVASGTLRADITVEDVVLLLLAVAGIAHRARTETLGAVERFVALALDGYRTEAAGPVPPPVRVFPWFGRDGKVSGPRQRRTASRSTQ